MIDVDRYPMAFDSKLLEADPSCGQVESMGGLLDPQCGGVVARASQTSHRLTSMGSTAKQHLDSH